MVSLVGFEPSTHSLKGIALPTELTAQRRFLYSFYKIIFNVKNYQLSAKVLIMKLLTTTYLCIYCEIHQMCQNLYFLLFETLILDKKLILFKVSNIEPNISFVLNNDLDNF